MMKQGKVYRKALFQGNRLLFALELTVIFLNTVLEMGVSIFLQQVLDTAAGVGRFTVRELGIICLALILWVVILSLLDRELLSRFLRRANAQYRCRLFEDLTRKSITAFSREKTGVYISMLTADAQVVEENYVTGMFSLFLNGLFLLMSLGLMFAYHWALALLSLALTALVMLCSTVLGGAMARSQKAVSDRSAGFVSGVKDILSGFSVVKSFQAEKEVQQMFTRKNGELEQAKFSNIRLSKCSELLSGTASFAMQMGVFLVGTVMALKGQITVGVILLFVQLTGVVARAVGQLASVVPAFLAARGLMDKAGKTLAANVQKKEGKAIASIGEGISCQNLSFGYERDNPILKGVDAFIQSGKSYALVGASGCGKSTLLNLLLGSYPDYSGSITIGGQEMREVETERLYDLVSLVQQTVFVFDSSIRDNITMFKSFPEAAIADAVRRSGLSRLVEEKGWDYPCGENGCNLSGGERQRISIARCLLKNTQVLLMDEATAALDAQTSAAVTQAVLDVEGLTRIVVTHKLEEQILRRFDQILVLKDGKIAQRGSFQELASQDGYFRALYRVCGGA